MEELEPLPLLIGMQDGVAAMETSVEISQKKFFLRNLHQNNLNFFNKDSVLILEYIPLHSFHKSPSEISKGFLHNSKLDSEF